MLIVAPGTVTDITLTVKDNAITVTWNLPQCASSINEIKIQYRKRTQSGWPYEVKAASPSDKELIIRGLENGVEYEVQVVVVDSSGRSFAKQAEKIAKIGKSSIYISIFSNSTYVSILYIYFKHCRTDG